MYSAYMHAIESPNDERGHVLTDMEYANRIIHRPDIFAIDRDRRIRFILPITYFFGLIAISILANADLTVINPDFADSLKPKYRVTLRRDVVHFPEKKLAKPQGQAKKRTMAPHGKSTKVTSRQKGAGSPNVVVTNNGIFKAMADARIQSYGMDDVISGVGTATGLDAVISGNMKLSKQGGTNFGRIEGGTIGTGAIGDGSGWGGGTDGVEDLMNGMEQYKSTNVGRIPAKVSFPSVAKAYSMGFDIGGSRKRFDIMRVVRSNLTALSHSYNKHLRHNPSGGGTVTLTWAIDEFGNVLNCEVVSSTLNNTEFEAELVRRIKLWQFGVIKVPGDVTSVVFPFQFALKANSLQASN